MNIVRPEKQSEVDGLILALYEAVSAHATGKESLNPQELAVVLASLCAMWCQPNMSRADYVKFSTKTYDHITKLAANGMLELGETIHNVNKETLQ